MCAELHSTLIAKLDPISANVSPYVKAVWDMGDGTIYELYRTGTPPFTNFNWMHVLHNYQLSKFYTVTLKLYTSVTSTTPDLQAPPKTIFANPRPPRPGLQDTLDYCLGTPSMPIPGSTTAPYSMVWYTARTLPLTGFDDSPTAPSPPRSVLGISKYYVAQVNTTTRCESKWDTVTVVISGQPNAPTPIDTAYCPGTTAQPLRVLGPLPFRAVPRWYDQDNPATLLPSTPVPNTNLTSRSYYVSLFNTKGCGESPRSELKVTIHPRSADPIVNIPLNNGVPANNVCLNAPAPNLSLYATALPGYRLIWWHTNATGGTGTNVPTNPIMSSVGTTNYYVSQAPIVPTPGGCESQRAAIPLTVHDNLRPSFSSGNQVVCQDASAQVVFNAPAGPTPYTFSYTVDAGTILTTTWDPSVSPNAFVTVPTNTAGSKTYRLVSLKDRYGCGEVLSTVETRTVEILQKPDATLTGATQACAFSVSLLSFTGSLGVPKYTFTYELDGVVQAPLETGPATSIATLDPSSTAPIGTHVYKLTKVSYVRNGTTCENPNLALTHNFNVLPSPSVTVSISGFPSNNIALCQNSTAPTVTYSIVNGDAPYTLRYKYNSVNAGTPPLPGSTTGPVTLPFPIATTTPGTHDFELLEVRDNNGCVRPYAGDPTTMASVRILQTPSGTVSGTASHCINASGTTPIVFTGSGGVTPFNYTFHYNVVSPTGTTNVSDPANPTTGLRTVAAPLSADGTFQYQLQRVSYDYIIGGTTTTCSSAPLTGPTATATVTVHPLPPTPAIPATTPVEFCQYLTATNPVTNTVAGTDLRWYDINATGGTQTPTQVIRTTAPGLTIYYVSRYNPTTTCESPRIGLPVQINAQPMANIGLGAVVCQGSTAPQLSLTGSLGSTDYTFAYEVQTGSTLTPGTRISNVSTTQLTVPTSTPGDFTYRLLKLTDAKGCEYTPPTPLTALFRVLATPDATLSAPSEICEGDVKYATFSGSTGKSPYTFSYTLNGNPRNGVSDGTGTLQVPIPSGAVVPQVFTLTEVSYADGTTCNRPLNSIATITVNPLPQATVSITGQTANSLLLCQNAPATSVIFTGSVGASPYSIQYNLNGTPQAAVSAGPTYTLPVSTASGANFAYALSKVTDAKGCTRNVTGTATVRILSLPDGTIEGSVKVCQNDPKPVITLKGTGASGTSPRYDFLYSLDGGTDIPISTPGGSDQVTLQAPTTTPGTYRYQLKSVSYTDGITCSKPLTGLAEIIVHDLPTATLKGVSNSIEVCQLSPFPEVRFEGLGGKAPYTFLYLRNGAPVSSTGNPFIENVSTKVFGVTDFELKEVRDANGCRQLQSGMLKVTVWPTPVVEAGPDKIMLEGARTTLEGSATNGSGIRFLWSPALSLSDPTIAQPVATPSRDTRYLLTATSDKGCSSSDDMLVRVLYTPIIPNTFTPNGDGFNDRWEIRHLDKYPDAVVEVFNDRGQIMLRSTGTYRPWDGTYKGMALPVGTYYYVIFPRSGRDKVAGYVTILR